MGNTQMTDNNETVLLIAGLIGVYAITKGVKSFSAAANWATDTIASIDHNIRAALIDANSKRIVNECRRAPPWDKTVCDKMVAVDRGGDRREWLTAGEYLGL